jgi:hypothetical protein
LLQGLVESGGCPRGSEVLLNGGFENGLDHWLVAQQPTGGSPAQFASTAIAHVSGLACLQGIAATPASSTRLIQNATEFVRAGGWYRLSGWIFRAEADAVGPIIAVQYVGPDGLSPATGGTVVRLQLPVERDRTEWTYCESPAFALPPMPAGCSSAWVVVDFVDCTGAAWWDDISLLDYGE